VPRGPHCLGEQGPQVTRTRRLRALVIAGTRPNFRRSRRCSARRVAPGSTCRGSTRASTSTRRCPTRCFRPRPAGPHGLPRGRRLTLRPDGPDPPRARARPRRARPDVVVVVGTSPPPSRPPWPRRTRLPVAHVEAGSLLRPDDAGGAQSRPDRPPVRRAHTSPSPPGSRTSTEGFPRARARLVGNPMVDALRAALPAIDRRAPARAARWSDAPPPGQRGRPRAPRRLLRRVRPGGRPAPRPVPRASPHARGSRRGGSRTASRPPASALRPAPLPRLPQAREARRRSSPPTRGLPEEAAVLGVPCPDPAQQHRAAHDRVARHEPPPGAGPAPSPRGRRARPQRPGAPGARPASGTVTPPTASRRTSPADSPSLKNVIRRDTLGLRITRFAAMGCVAREHSIGRTPAAPGTFRARSSWGSPSS
jgi:hypothetical protein